MSQVPKTPGEFFGVWLPKAFEPVAATLAGKSSLGALVFQVGSEAPLAIRVLDGRISVAEGLASDAIAQVRLSAGAFEPVMVRGAELLALDGADSERHLLVLRALTLDAEGCIAIPDGVGIGIDVDTDFVDAHRAR